MSRKIKYTWETINGKDVLTRFEPYSTGLGVEVNQ